MKKMLLLCSLLFITASCSNNTSVTSGGGGLTDESVLTCSSNDDCTITQRSGLATSPETCGCMPYASECPYPINVEGATKREDAYQLYCEDKEQEIAPDNCPTEFVCSPYFGVECVNGKCVLKED